MMTGDVRTNAWSLHSVSYALYKQLDRSLGSTNFITRVIQVYHLVHHFEDVKLPVELAFFTIREVIGSACDMDVRIDHGWRLQVDDWLRIVLDFDGGVDRSRRLGLDDWLCIVLGLRRERCSDAELCGVNNCLSMESRQWKLLSAVPHLGINLGFRFLVSYVGSVVE